MRDPRACLAGDGQRIGAGDEQVAGVEAQRHIRALEQAPDVFLALDHRAVVRVKRDGEPAPGADLLGLRDPGAQDVPLRRVRPVGRLVAGPTRRGGQDEHARAGVGEERGALSNAGELRGSVGRPVQHGRNEPADECQAVRREPGPDGRGIGGEKPARTELGRGESGQGDLRQNAIGVELDPPAGDLGDPPRDGSRGELHLRRSPR